MFQYSVGKAARARSRQTGRRLMDVNDVADIARVSSPAKQSGADVIVRRPATKQELSEIIALRDEIRAELTR
jgi:hypothetical protein